MHQALAVPELFHLIVEELCSYDQRRSTLISLSLSCRRFTEPCIKALYECATVNLLDVVKCLPDVVETERFAGVKSWTFRDGGISYDKETWERFDYYATKTWELKISFLEISDEIFAALLTKSQLHERHIAGRPVLFPLLQSLYLNDWTSKHYKEQPNTFALFPFLSVWLSELHIESESSVDGVDSLPGLKLLGHSLQDLCPNLECLTIDIVDKDGELSPDVEAFITKSISRNRNLKTLGVNVFILDGSTVQLMLDLPLLEDLRLQIYEMVLYDPPGPDVLHLSSLKDLDISVDRYTLHSILGAMGKPKIESAELWTTPFHDELAQEPSNFREVISTFARRTSAEHLETLTIYFPCKYRVRMSHIDPILAFKNLQTLELLQMNLWLEDEDIQHLAEVQTQLTTLRVPAVAGPTLESLVSLSNNCVDLTELEIAIDATEVPEIAPEILSQLANKSLEKLTVTEKFSPIKDADEVYRFLLKVFPSILSVVLEDSKSDLWAQVSKAIDRRHLNI